MAAILGQKGSPRPFGKRRSMTNTTKIVFIGAGSAAFGLSMFRDVFSTDELAGSTLTLVDTNPEALERMLGLAKVRMRKTVFQLNNGHTGARRAAWEGAAFVVISVSSNMTRMWKSD